MRSRLKRTGTEAGTGLRELRSRRRSDAGVSAPIRPGCCRWSFEPFGFGEVRRIGDFVCFGGFNFVCVVPIGPQVGSRGQVADDNRSGEIVVFVLGVARNPIGALDRLERLERAGVVHGFGLEAVACVGHNTSVWLKVNITNYLHSVGDAYDIVYALF